MNDKPNQTLNQTSALNEQDVAHFLLDNSSRAAHTMQQFASSQYQGVSYAALREELSAQIRNACSDDAQSTCNALAAQAITLDLLFETLCGQAICSRTNGASLNIEYLRLALKCQKQSAATRAMLQYLLPKDQKNKNELSI